MKSWLLAVAREALNTSRAATAKPGGRK